MVQENSVKPKIIVIGGPTAVGKSDLAIKCAQKFNGEVVGADSMQIYRHMNIGTGKVTAEEMQGIAHHMIDILSPDARYSAGAYLQDVVPVIDDVIARNKLPIIVGGTGLYINALLSGMNFSDADRSDEVREKWKNLLSQHGNNFIYDELVKRDPISAQKISVNDIKRIIRALEIFEVTGKPKSENSNAASCPYDYKFFILNRDREELYGAINNRVDKMFELGLMDEVLALKQYRDRQSMQAIGYKQIFELLDGKYADLAQAKSVIQQLSRNYAKRQLTFFRGMKVEKTWIDYHEYDRIFEEINNFVSKNT